MSVLSQLRMEATAEETLRACLGEWARLARGRGLLGLEEAALAEAGLGALGDLVGELNRYAGLLEETEDRPLCAVCGGPADDEGV